jgi:hypothetical protein
MGIVGIHDKRDALADESSGDRVDFNLSGIGDLFDAGNDYHYFLPEREMRQINDTTYFFKRAN